MSDQKLKMQYRNECARNYRVIRHANGSLAVHEAYYDMSGKVIGITERPASFAETTASLKSSGAIEGGRDQIVCARPLRPESLSADAEVFRRFKTGASRVCLVVHRNYEPGILTYLIQLTCMRHRETVESKVTR